MDFEKIQEVYVQIGFVDKLFGTGTSYAMTAGFSGFAFPARQGYAFPGIQGLRPSFAALREPYEVQRLLQEAMAEAKQTQD